MREKQAIYISRFLLSVSILLTFTAFFFDKAVIFVAALVVIFYLAIFAYTSKRIFPTVKLFFIKLFLPTAH